MRRESPSTSILVYTGYDEGPAIRALIRAGAAGLVLKNESMEDVVEAIRIVAAGGAWPRECLRERIEARETLNLTPRERSVLAALVMGRTEREITAALGITDRTVRNVLRSLRERLGVESSTRLAVVVTALGLVDPRLDERPW